MQKLKKYLFITGTAVLACSMGFAAGLPSVSVSGVTVTPGNVLRSTPAIGVSATVTPTYDSAPSPSDSTTVTKCVAGSTGNGNNNCGTGNTAILCKKSVATTTVTINNQTLTVTASDPYSSSVLTGPSPFSGTLSTPVSPATDGLKTVTVSASISEDVITQIDTALSYYDTYTPGGPDGGTCSGNLIQSSTTPGTPSTVTKTGSGSATSTYILDINSPILTLQPNTSQPTVPQGGDKDVHNLLMQGSAGTPYTVTDTIVGPGGYTAFANGLGNFNASNSPKNDGIAPNEHDLVGVHVSCDAPTGLYTASATANTVDLGGLAFDPLSSIDFAGPPAGGATDTFTVTPGSYLVSQTAVVSELPPSGDYAPMSCFTANTSGRKVTTFPGSLHITAVVNTGGPCAGSASMSGVVVTLTLPVGFAFDVTGASPAAHVFSFPASSGFDFHYPGPEIALPKSAITVSGQTVTVDLTSLGSIPTANTVYVRAHAVFNGGAVPADGTQFVFTTGASANLSGIGATTASSTQVVTKRQSCVDGN